MASESGAWMPLYIGDYLADTMHLSGAEHGAYLLLIMHYWRNGPLPDDDKALSAIARTDRKQWSSEIGPVVREFFVLNEGRLHHKRIDHELATAGSHIEQRRAAGKASAAKRALQREANENPTSVGTSVEVPVDIPHQRNGRPSPSPSPVEDNLATSETPSRARHPANGAGPPRWDDIRIVEADGRPCCNGTYIDTVSEKLAEAACLPLVPLADKTMIGWLADGYEYDEIAPVIRRVVERSADRPRSLAYFDKAVREARPTWHPLKQERAA